MSVLYHGREYVVNGQIYTGWQKFYTAAGIDGSDKYNLCSDIHQDPVSYCHVHVYLFLFVFLSLFNKSSDCEYVPRLMQQQIW